MTDQPKIDEIRMRANKTARMATGGNDLILPNGLTLSELLRTFVFDEVRPLLDALAERDRVIERQREGLIAVLEWIDAVPAETPLPAMPGFDRDELNALLYALADHKEE
jgi:hypothetical protein